MIKSIKLGDILGVDIDAATTPAVVKALYNSKIGSLNADISNLQVYQVMGYTREGSGPYIYKDGETEVTGIMAAIAGANINDIGSTIEGLKAKEIFNVETTAVLKLFETNELDELTIMNLPNELTTKMNNVTVEKLVSTGLINITEEEQETAYYESIKGLKLKDIILGKFGE